MKATRRGGCWRWRLLLRKAAARTILRDASLRDAPQDEVSYQTLMVRSAPSRVSNHAASGEAARVNRKTL